MRLWHAVAVLLPCAITWAAEPFVYRTAGGPVFSVTEAGLSRIELAGQTVATGEWHAADASYVRTNQGRWAPFTVTERTIEKVADDRVVVRHSGPEMAVRYDYRFAGEDVVISARAENLRPEQPVQCISYEGLTFLFADKPEGHMVSQDPGWLAWPGHANEYRGFHPSFENRLGGSYGADARFGVGTSPVRAGLSYTAFLWYGGQGSPGARRLHYAIPTPIPHGGALTHAMRLRVSADREWKHLLAPYREEFTAQFGPVRYNADHRPLSQAVLADDVSVKPDNPLGFHGDARRVDLADGAQRFCDMVVPGLRDGGGQGVIIWALGGWERRGAMYRPDFDVLPPEVERNLPLLKAKFAEAGLRLGACARPGEFVFRGNWTQDWTLRINAGDQAHLEVMWGRFKRLIDQGFGLFYCDTFGASVEDVKAMRFYREKMGRDIQCFVEHPLDVILPYAGCYMEVNRDPQTKRYSIFWGLDRFWEIAQWLCPGVQAAAVSRVDESKLAPSDERPYEFMMRQHLTPFSPDWRVKAEAAELRGLCAKYLLAPDRWRP